MKKFFLVFFVVGFFCFVKISGAQVATSVTDRAFYNLKESVTELVTAKDKDDKNSLAYRIVAYKQVIDLSIAEAEDVRVKLLTTIPLNGEEEWHASTLESLSEAVLYFNKERKAFNSLQVKNTEELRPIAERFREWREKNYIKAVTSATDYIAIKEASLALSVASMRREKIGEDLDAIPIFKSASRARVLGELSNLLLRSRDIVNKGIEEEREAYRLFSEFYLTETGTSTPTSTLALPIEINTSTATTILPITESGVVAPETASTTPTSTIVVIDEDQRENEDDMPKEDVSIKDLIRSALARVQETYHIYIEMSKVAQSLK